MKNKSVKIAEVEPGCRLSTAGRWANKLLDDFWASGDEAWQVFEFDGKEITRKSIIKAYTTLQNACQRKAKEFGQKVKVSRKYDKLYIYAEILDE